MSFTESCITFDTGLWVSYGTPPTLSSPSGQWVFQTPAATSKTIVARKLVTTGYGTYTIKFKMSSARVPGINIAFYFYTDTNQINMGITGTYTSKQIYVTTTRNGVGYDLGGPISSVNFEDSAYHMMVVTYTASLLKITMDGVTVLNAPESTTTPFIPVPPMPLIIQTACSGSNTSAFTLTVDEVDYVASTTMYTLATAVSPSGGGSVVLSPAGGSYASGTVVTLTATPASGYVFSNWSGGLTGSTNPVSVTITGNASVTATFIPITATFSDDCSSSPPILGQPSSNSKWYAGGSISPTSDVNGWSLKLLKGSIAGNNCTIWTQLKNFGYGTYIIRFRVPQKRIPGMVYSIYLYPQPNLTPPSDELDFPECYGDRVLPANDGPTLGPRSLSITSYYNGPSSYVFWIDGVAKTDPTGSAPTHTAINWEDGSEHIFQMEYSATQIVFKIDGVTSYTWTKTSMIARPGTQSLYIATWTHASSSPGGDLPLASEWTWIIRRVDYYPQGVTPPSTFNLTYTSIPSVNATVNGSVVPSGSVVTLPQGTTVTVQVPTQA